MFKLNQIIYRVAEPDDGGDYVPLTLKVIAVMPDALVVQRLTGQTETISLVAGQQLYESKLDCAKECWKLNGDGDAFERLCRRKGISTEEGKAEELAYQKEIWGAFTYDEVLEFLI